MGIENFIYDGNLDEIGLEGDIIGMESLINCIITRKSLDYYGESRYNLKRSEKATRQGRSWARQANQMYC